MFYGNDTYIYVYIHIYLFIHVSVYHLYIRCIYMYVQISSNALSDILTSTCICIGWLWSVGSIKLYFFFAEYRLFDRALLQKRTIILSILLTEATPFQKICIYKHMHVHLIIFVDTCICIV